ncbi:hypothetical protein AVEN_254839-1 [Araneus ventricosus]|uniref:Uncharacterized protein n=1 Tax=Araneus ventricosus TaxID=182803 RepID=A0A4Y2LIC2_ARAVE|nr:hypothetical protein AVEN_254839-1 [Araneus ventricosus]
MPRHTSGPPRVACVVGGYKTQRQLVAQLRHQLPSANRLHLLQCSVTRLGHQELPVWLPARKLGWNWLPSANRIHWIQCQATRVSNQWRHWLLTDSPAK